MRITTKAIFDIETGALLHWEGFDFEGEVAQARRKKKDPYEETARKREEEAHRISQEELALKRGAISETTPALEQYYGGGGDVRQTPFYRSLLTTGIEDTSRAYDRALVATRRRAQTAGFGYEQPATIGSEGALEQERARELARVPREAVLQATEPQFRAIGMRTGQAGLYQPLGYTGAATRYLGMGANIAEQRRQRRLAWFKAISSVGMKAASAFTGGKGE